MINTGGYYNVVMKDITALHYSQRNKGLKVLVALRPPSSVKLKIEKKDTDDRYNKLGNWRQRNGLNNALL